MKMTFQEIGIIATGPCIANQLRDVNTICRRSWYIAAHVWKIYGKINRNLSVHFNSKLFSGIKNEDILSELENEINLEDIKSIQMKENPVL